MKKKYPFKFLDAYGLEDFDIFFGRSDEIEALYEMVFQSDLIVVYGASGTGKTSLIQCGLANKFQSHDWLPLYIRRGTDLNRSMEETLLAAAGLDRNGPKTAPIEIGLLNDLATTSLPKTPLTGAFQSVYLRNFKPIYLIFDQFEELYVLGSPEEQSLFFHTVQAILQIGLPIKIIFSIREEYLGYLYDFERVVPDLLRKKIRVEPMNLAKVKTVLAGVGKLPESNVRLKSGEEDNIVREIFKNLRENENVFTIQLPYLQVFLDKLYLQITNDETRQTEAEFSMEALEKTGNIGDVLRNFLDDQVLKTAALFNQNPENIWHILSPFVTLEGTKEPLTPESIALKLFDTDESLVIDTLQLFVKSRLLRYNEENRTYEIAHDALANQIKSKRSASEIAVLEVQNLVKNQYSINPETREFFTEKQLAFIDSYITKAQISAVEYDWIIKSREHVEREKLREKRMAEAEMANARIQAQKERELRLAAEKNAKIASNRTLIAGFALVVSLGFAISLYFKNENEQKAMKEILVKNSEIAKKQIEADSLKTVAQTAFRAADSSLQIARNNFEQLTASQISNQQLEINRMHQEVDVFIRAEEYTAALSRLDQILKLDPQNPLAKQKKRHILKQSK